MITDAKIGFIGGGNMANCMVKQLVNNVFTTEQIIIADRNIGKCNYFVQAYGIKTTLSALDVLKESDIIVLAIKPLQIKTLIQALSSHFQPNQLVISVAAGLSVHNIQDKLSTKQSIVRAMPNTPCQLGIGATGLFTAKPLSEQHQLWIKKIFNCLGIYTWLENESQFDMVTALSGSGPGFMFYLMQGLIKASMKLGLSESDATRLTLQTVYGAAALAIDSELDLDTLTNQVTSKGGTTEQGLKMLEIGGIHDLLEKTLVAARMRANALGDEI